MPFTASLQPGCCGSTARLLLSGKKNKMKHKGHSCFNGGYAIFVSEGRFVCAGHMLMGEKHGPNAAAL